MSECPRPAICSRPDREARAWRAAEMTELRASATSLGATQSAAAAAVEKRAADLEAADRAVIADLRDRLQAKVRLGA